jgi:hypothetical protein
LTVSNMTSHTHPTSKTATRMIFTVTITMSTAFYVILWMSWTSWYFTICTTPTNKRITETFMMGVAPIRQGLL